ncbi:hypothetical protein PoB_006890900 [Plakobranchus ocellatus]|uniref:Uncharacterized protein n=1 Tax=Plakobranchus ocellatus TaxID=259542 RepID=A0AAV4DE44_9GAST|nr:hypothetical protein PoB_006890900 [Plakobranchus ocellatus]
MLPEAVLRYLQKGKDVTHVMPRVVRQQTDRRAKLEVSGSKHWRLPFTEAIEIIEDMSTGREMPNSQFAEKEEEAISALSSSPLTMTSVLPLISHRVRTVYFSPRHPCSASLGISRRPSAHLAMPNAEIKPWNPRIDSLPVQLSWILNGNLMSDGLGRPSFTNNHKLPFRASVFLFSR